MNGFFNVIRGLNGTVELNRLSLFLAALGYVFGTLAFQAWSMSKGSEFDVTAFCLAFGGGFAALIGGGAGAVAIKDRNVASAKVIAETGSKPATPPAPAPQPQPELSGTDETDERPSYAR
ncbi:MAG: hypothetical protein ACREUE_15630 [Panacagrimonas sp.]